MGCQSSKSQVQVGGDRYVTGSAAELDGEGSLAREGDGDQGKFTDIGDFAAEHKQVRQLLSASSVDPAERSSSIGETPHGSGAWRARLGLCKLAHSMAPVQPHSCADLASVTESLKAGRKTRCVLRTNTRGTNFREAATSTWAPPMHRGMQLRQPGQDIVAEEDEFGLEDSSSLPATLGFGLPLHGQGADAFGDAAGGQGAAHASLAAQPAAHGTGSPEGEDEFGFSTPIPASTAGNGADSDAGALQRSGVDSGRTGETAGSGHPPLAPGQRGAAHSSPTQPRLRLDSDPAPAGDPG